MFLGCPLSWLDLYDSLAFKASVVYLISSNYCSFSAIYCLRATSSKGDCLSTEESLNMRKGLLLPRL